MIMCTTALYSPDVSCMIVYYRVQQQARNKAIGVIASVASRTVSILPHRMFLYVFTWVGVGRRHTRAQFTHRGVVRSHRQQESLYNYRCQDQPLSRANRFSMTAFWASPHNRTSTHEHTGTSREISFPRTMGVCMYVPPWLNSFAEHQFQFIDHTETEGCAL